MCLSPIAGSLAVTNDLDFLRKCQLVVEAFDGEIVLHKVEQAVFVNLLLSREPLVRCNDELSHTLGLFDPRSGDLFEIDESDLFS